MSVAAQELLNEENPDIQVTVGEAGTGGGFEVFCAGETDISDASRPIEEDEVAVCEEAGIEYTELQVATDALTVVVHPDLAVDCLTIDQLDRRCRARSPRSTNWNELDPSFPDQEISLFGPGHRLRHLRLHGRRRRRRRVRDATRDDYEASEDDNVLVQGVAGTEGAAGFFGYTYYEENPTPSRRWRSTAATAASSPSAETAQAGEYTPLARPLFIYVNNAKYADNEASRRTSTSTSRTSPTSPRSVSSSR